ncbi:hypothetical protein MRQ86_36255 [Streptomyces sp. MMS21 TC-5]|uniref:hypothetical protein n=1 Tax=Streptomyces sp. MMS21 TC-5 TaxID=2925833 RepID=UPI001F60D32C|nr:hypothetical protein [Streptomyces sp. MMS21 TC-5]MCI4085656.1 hypothetical protein [Streptomyces sp. MMS21 TC-5]
MNEIEERNALRHTRLRQLLADRADYEDRRRTAATEGLELASYWQASQTDTTASAEFRELARTLAARGPIDSLDPLPMERKALEDREAKLREQWYEPVALVRTTVGEVLRVYHLSSKCGQVSGAGRYPWTFTRMFQSEAKAMLLRVCSRRECRRTATELQRASQEADRTT